MSRYLLPLIEQLIDGLAQAGHRARQFVGPTWRLAEPERNSRWLTVRILDEHPALLNLQHLVRHIAELKDIAGHTLECKIFIQTADEQALGLQNDVVIELIRYRAAIGDRGQTRTTSPSQHAIDRITMQISTPSSASRMKTVSQHLDHTQKLLLVKVTIRTGTGERPE